MVPVKDAAVTSTAWPGPLPRGMTHATDVAETHAALGQLVMPTRAGALTSRDPKPRPASVRLAKAVAAPLKLLTKLTTGAEKEREFLRLRQLQVCTNDGLRRIPKPS